MTGFCKFIAGLADRVGGIEREFLDHHVEKLAEQRHLDRDSSERLYWHAGYVSALRDVLNKLQKDAHTA